MNFLEGSFMANSVRPATMERITNFELANTFIEEQIKEIRNQVGDIIAVLRADKTAFLKLGFPDKLCVV